MEFLTEFPELGRGDLRDFKKAVMNEYPRFLSPIMMHKTIYMVEFLLLSFIFALGARLRVHLKSACFSLARSLDSLSFSLSLCALRARSPTNRFGNPVQLF